MKRYLGIVVLFSSSKIRISGSPVAQLVKNLSASAGDRKDRDWILGWGRSPGEGNGNPFQDSCLENPMDGGDWRATVPWVPKSWTRLSDLAWMPFFPRTSKFGRVFWALHQVICWEKEMGLKASLNAPAGHHSPKGVPFSFLSFSSVGIFSF